MFDNQFVAGNACFTSTNFVGQSEAIVPFQCLAGKREKMRFVGRQKGISRDKPNVKHGDLDAHALAALKVEFLI
jgi:hypothetical protein